MGLLDMFNDPQSAGLLGAGAQILERSGDTSRPYGIGQALGTGISSYMQINNSMRARKQQEEQERAQQAMREMQMQEMQAEMAQKQRSQEEAVRLQDFYKQRAGGGQAAPGSPYSPEDAKSAYQAASQGGMKSYDPEKLNQVMALTRQGVSSEQAAAQVFGGGQPQSGGGRPQPAPASQQSASSGASLYESMMQEAQALQAAGFIPQAQAKMKEAISVRPKYATEGRTVMGPDGKPMLVQMADDGNVRPIQGGYGAAEKLHFGDNGQNLVGMDQYTGQVKSSLGKQQTLESQASERSAAAGRAQSAGQFNARLAFDKQQVEGTGPDASEAMIDAIGTGKMAPPSGYALRNPKMLKMMERVAQKFPDFDATEYDGKKRAMRDFTTGRQGDSIRSFAVASDHLGQLKSLIGALDNGNVPLINKYSNIVAQQTGSAAPTNFDAAKGIVAKEVLKSIVAGGGGVEERQELAHLLDNAKTTKQLNGVVDTYLHLMAAQKSGLERQYELSTGRKDAATRFNYKTDASGGHGGAQQPAASGSKSISLSDIAETARKSGRTTAEVTAAARAKGYTIGGQ